MGLRARFGEERGAYAILFVILTTVMFTFAAIAVDLGAARVDARENQKAADLANLAAGELLATGKSRDACSLAWSYIKFNLDDLPATGAEMPCNSFPANGACTTSTAAANYPSSGLSRGRFTITFRYPIPDSEVQDPYATGPYTGLPGDQCRRLRITVSSKNRVFFAGIVGGNNSNTPATSVIQAESPGGGSTAAALMVLDPYGCKTLRVTSQNVQILIHGNVNTPTSVVVDSDGTGNDCTGNEYVVEVNDTNALNKICVAVCDTPPMEGSIKIYAMDVGQTGCVDYRVNRACDPDDVSTLRVRPPPTRAPSRVTRAPVDHAYNCKTTYPLYHGIPIAGCAEAGTRDPYIDQLKAAVGTSGQPALGYPGTPFQRWTTWYAANGGGNGQQQLCTVQTPLVVPEGNWWIDCPNGFTVQRALTFRGGNIVADGSISVGSQGVFNMNHPGAGLGPLPPLCITSLCPLGYGSDAAYIYLRKAGALFDKSGGGSLDIRNTMLYIDDGSIDFTGGQGTMNWTAPSAGPFYNLALWSDASSGTQRVHKMAGGSGITVRGVFFTPEANAFTYTGGSGIQQMQAVYLSYQLEVTGQGVLEMNPDVLAPVVLQEYGITYLVQ